MPWLQLRNNVRKKARNSQLERSASMVELQLMSVEETSFYRIRRSCLRHCIKITWLMYVEHESWSGFKGHSLPTSFTSSFVLCFTNVFFIMNKSHVHKVKRHILLCYFMFGSCTQTGPEEEVICWRTIFCVEALGWSLFWINTVSMKICDKKHKTAEQRSHGNICLLLLILLQYLPSKSIAWMQMSSFKK